MTNTRYAVEGLTCGALTVTGLTFPFYNPQASLVLALLLLLFAIWQSEKHPRSSLFDR